MILKVGRYWINTDAITYIEERSPNEIAIHLVNGTAGGAVLLLTGELRGRFLQAVAQLGSFQDAGP